MGECRHHLPREPAIPALNLSSPDLVAVLTQMIWWDEIITMNLPSAHSKARHELGPPFQTLLDFSGLNLHILASTLPADVDAIIHALASLIQSHSSTLTSISIPLSPSFACSSLIPLLVAALPHLGFSPGKPTVLSALATCAYQKKGKLPPSVHLTEVTAPEDLAVKIAVESTLFRLPPSYVDRLQTALEYMTYGTAQARDRHYLAWYASPQGAEREAVAYLTLRVGRGVAYVQGAGVVEPWRRQGIVRAMLDHAIDMAIELGYEVVATSAWTEEAAAAWKAMGFRDVGEYTEWTWTNTADREKLTGLHN